MSCLGSGESASVPTGMLRALLTVVVTLAPERRPPLPGLAPWLILISTSRTRRRSAAWMPKCPLAACRLSHFMSSGLESRIGPPSPEEVIEIPALPSMRAIRKSSDAAPSEMLAWLTGECHTGSRKPKPESAKPPCDRRVSVTVPSREARATEAPCPPWPCVIRSTRRSAPGRASSHSSRPSASAASSGWPGLNAISKPPRASASKRAIGSASPVTRSSTLARAGTAPGRMKPRGTASET